MKQVEMINMTESRTREGLPETRYESENLAETRHERWAHCHVNWTAVWIGALSTFCVIVLLGLVGVALGANFLKTEDRLVDLHKLGIAALIFSVCVAFFSGVAGGWVATRIAGILHAEPGMLHGSFVWLLAVPLLVLSSALGASSLLGGWYSGLTPNAASTTNTPFFRPTAPGASASTEEIAAYRTQEADYNRNVQKWHDDTPKVIRNSALVTFIALLLGLIGCVLGGWIGTGEPMNFSHYRTRKPRYHTA